MFIKTIQPKVVEKCPLLNLLFHHFFSKKASEYDQEML